MALFVDTNVEVHAPETIGVGVMIDWEKVSHLGVVLEVSWCSAPGEPLVDLTAREYQISQ